MTHHRQEDVIVFFSSSTILARYLARRSVEKKNQNACDLGGTFSLDSSIQLYIVQASQPGLQARRGYLLRFHKRQ